MEIEKQYIVKINGKWQILYYGSGRCFKTSNGAFDQRETYLEEIPAAEAMKILDSNNAEIPNSLIEGFNWTKNEDIDVVGKCPNCGVEFHIHKTKSPKK